ncbi:hypothetical protein RhiirB3_79756 [Rhizophagus irregularis]|nr:hypothetical protein RhiirB3_79756 [Rhizophagus irregularis]
MEILAGIKFKIWLFNFGMVRYFKKIEIRQIYLFLYPLPFFPTPFLLSLHSLPFFVLCPFTLITN